MVKNLSAVQETRVQSPRQEGILEEGMAILATLVFLPGKFHGQGSLAGHSPRGCKGWDVTVQLSTHTCKHLTRLYQLSIAI